MARVRVKVTVSDTEVLNELADRIGEAVEELMQEGSEIAEILDTSSAVHNNDVTVQFNGDGLNSSIHASGEQLFVAEFGAGDTVEDSIMSDGSGIPVRSGSWSERNMRQYSSTGRWTHDGETFTMIAPRRGMLRAYEHVNNNLPSRVGEKLHD